MGNCGGDEGRPIFLIFNCNPYGTHEISTMDGLKLKQVLEELCRRIRKSTSNIKDVVYKDKSLNKYTKIRDLNLPNEAVLTVKMDN